MILPSTAPAPWPRLCRHLPLTSGRLRATVDDFRVEELPAYGPSGEGEHLLLWVEKRGKTTVEMVQLLARHVGVPEREVGYAGLKDKHAVTGQQVSIPARGEALLASFSHPDVQVRNAVRHRNKLRVGHLHGNRFDIRIQDVGDFEAAESILLHLKQHGVANYFGAQRFGREAGNAEMGFALLRGERLPRPPDRFLRRMVLSAAQSDLFNAALAARLLEGTWGTALLGDVLKKSDTGGEFVCTDPSIDQARLDAFEISVAGPMFGPDMRLSEHGVALAEAQLLASRGLKDLDFERGRKDTLGARRAYRVNVADMAWQREDAHLRVTFSLPAGSYATVVLGEAFETDAARR